MWKRKELLSLRAMRWQPLLRVSSKQRDKRNPAQSVDMQATLGLHPHSKVGDRGSYSGRSQTLNSDRKTEMENIKPERVFVSSINWSMLREGRELWSILANGSCLTSCPERNLGTDRRMQKHKCLEGDVGRQPELKCAHDTQRHSRATGERDQAGAQICGQTAASLTDICWLDPLEQDGGGSTTMLSFYLHPSC